jgi:hypothetical protein
MAAFDFLPKSGQKIGAYGDAAWHTPYFYALALVQDLRFEMGHIFCSMAF